MPVDSTKLDEAFLHASNRGMTAAGQKAYNTTYDSTGIAAAVSGALRDILPFVNSKAELDIWMGDNPGVLIKYDKVALTEIPGSNGQSWIIQASGEQVTNFVVEQLLTSRTTFAVPNAYVLELYQGSAGPRILPNDGDWWYRPDQGIVRFELNNTPSDLGWGIPDIIVYALDPEFLATIGGGGTASVSSEPIYIGAKDTDDSWMLLRDVGANFTVNGVTSITSVNDKKLHFFRREGGVYISKSQLGNSIHSDRFVVNNEAGGLFLPHGDEESQVIRVSHRGDHGAVFGNYFGAAFVTTDGPDSFSHAYTVGKDIPFSTLDPDASNWVYVQTDLQIYEFPPSDLPYALSEISSWTDRAGVAMRIVVNYQDTGQILYESQTDYGFRNAPAHLTSVGQTKIKLQNPVSVDKNRQIRYTIHASEPVGVRKHAYLPWFHVYAVVKEIRVAQIATKPEVGASETAMCKNQHLSTLHDYDGMALTDENGEFIIFNEYNIDHRVSDWAYSKTLGLETLHDEEGHALTDEEGELIIFDGRILGTERIPFNGDNGGDPWLFEEAYGISNDFAMLGRKFTTLTSSPIAKYIKAKLTIFDTFDGAVLHEKVSYQVPEGHIWNHVSWGVSFRIGPPLTESELSHDIVIPSANWTIRVELINELNHTVQMQEGRYALAGITWPVVTKSLNTYVINRGSPRHHIFAPGSFTGSVYSLEGQLISIVVADAVTDFTFIIKAPQEWHDNASAFGSNADHRQLAISVSDNNGQFYTATLSLTVRRVSKLTFIRYGNLWDVSVSNRTGAYSEPST